MLKVLYFRTYPPFCTSGHLRGYRVTRMDTSVTRTLVHNTHIYKYNFHLDIYIFMCSWVCLICLVFKFALVFLKIGGYCGQIEYNTSVHAAFGIPTTSG